MNKLLLETATGRDWQLATEAQRREFCAQSKTYSMSEEALRHALDTLLLGRGNSLAALKLHEAVSMVTGAWPQAGGGTTE
jgi:hypothetical protein